MTTPRRSVEKCTFCGKSRHAVESLIAGPPGIYICNECVELCNTILLEELKRGGRSPRTPRPPGAQGEARTPAATAAGPAAGTTSGVPVQVKSPREIRTFLDQYVVGQD